MKYPILIHYGSTCFDLQEFEPIKNQTFIKPIGGLWTSPVNSEWGWKTWCEQQNFRECSVENSFTLRIKDNSNVLIIDSVSDLNKLPYFKDKELEECMSSLGDTFYDRFFHFPDFEKLAQTYDAIWLTEKGECETRHSEPRSLYGWDCESFLILNSHCIEYTKYK